jgi:hypothetical protein
MTDHLDIKADGAGFPHAEVPFECMWELVEYLSWQRIAVTYQYHETHFVVTFPRHNAQMAQQVLDRWLAASRGMLQVA